MMRIVFTGPAKVEGIHLERKHLIALANSRGHQVQNKVDATTDWLVCSDEFINQRTSAKLRAYGASARTQRITPAQFLDKMNY